MEKAVREAGYPVELSYTAGTFVCNSVFYRLRHFHPDRFAGFIHVPYCTSQVLEKRGHNPFMPVAMMQAAFEAAIGALSIEKS